MSLAAWPTSSLAGTAVYAKPLPGCVNMLLLVNVKVEMGKEVCSTASSLYAIDGLPCLWGALSCQRWRTI
jgi:hypothetical protein